MERVERGGGLMAWRQWRREEVEGTGLKRNKVGSSREAKVGGEGVKER